MFVRVEGPRSIIFHSVENISKKSPRNRRSLRSGRDDKGEGRASGKRESTVCGSVLFISS